jgi:AcrR family transcriptional regulator
VRLSLRPLAAAIGTSPRVLLYLFGSKSGLVRALLARARADELAGLERLARDRPASLAALAEELWSWLAAPQHRGLLTLWVEAYAQALVDPGGEWAGFPRSTVDDWLELLRGAQPAHARRGRRAEQQRTLVLAVLRGALLDLLGTGDVDRVGAAVLGFLRDLPESPQVSRSTSAGSGRRGR